MVISSDKPGGTGFEFDRLGVRIPAVVISAYTPPGTILNTSFDHTSALSTVVNRFGLPKGKLGMRQAAAPDVGEGLMLPDPRQDWPAISQPAAADIGVAQRVAALGTAIMHAKAKPLLNLQIKILGLTREQQQEIAKSPTVFEADAELLKFEAQLAAKRAVKFF